MKFALQIASKNIDLESDVLSLLSKSHKKTSIWRVTVLAHYKMKYRWLFPAPPKYILTSP